jgi:hypothetical protein
MSSSSYLGFMPAPKQRQPQQPPRQRRAEWQYQVAPWMTHYARPECGDEAGVAHHKELVALQGEVPNVISEGFARPLLATHQVPGVAGPHICALEVAGEDLLEILLIVDHVSR